MVSDPLGINSLEINGVTVSSGALVSLLNMITKPDPTRWFRFERKENLILIETRCEPPSSPSSL